MAIMSGAVLAGSKRELAILCSLCARLSVSKAMAPGWNEMSPVRCKAWCLAQNSFPSHLHMKGAQLHFQTACLKDGLKKFQCPPKKAIKNGFEGQKHGRLR